VLRAGIAFGCAGPAILARPRPTGDPSENTETMLHACGVDLASVSGHSRPGDFRCKSFVASEAAAFATTRIPESIGAQPVFSEPAARPTVH